MKVYGALELAQLEWFLDSAKPSAASFIYRVIYVSDLKQIQVSDGTNWIPFLNTSTNQTLSGDITFSGQQIFNGLHRLSVTTNSATGAIVALAPTTPITEFTGAVTSVSGVTSGASGATVMFINRSGSPFTVLDEDAGATAGNRIRTGTGASITLTNNASILLSYAGDSRWHVVGGTGSSSAGGAKNYFAISSANPNFSQNSVSPWSACTLTFTSGVPSGAPTLTATQMAIAATATNPLLQSQSNYNLQLVKSGAAQYQGFISGELTIDREDLAKVLTGSFSYEVASPTVNFSGTSAQDLEIWVYNTVSGAWTQPAGFRGMNTSSGTGVVSFTFQTDSTAANNKYKIAVITQQTSATAYSVNFNDFSVGPTAVINGTPVTDWVDRGTITIASVSNPQPSKGTIVVDKIYMRRVGDSAQFRYIYNQSSAGASGGTGNYLFSLPAGMSFDSTKINITGNINSIIGNFGGRFSGGIDQYSGFAYPVNSTQFSVYLQFQRETGTTQGAGVLGSTIGTLSIAGDMIYNIDITAPIVGWSSNVQISSDTDTRVISAQAGCSTAFAYSATVPINFDTVVTDRSGSVTPSATVWKFTAPVSGDYRVSTNLINGTGSISVILYKNGVSFRSLMSVTTTAITSASTTITLNAGEYIDVRGAGAATLVSGTTVNTISIERLSGPSVIAASETVAMTYTGTATGTLTTGSTNFLATVPTKVFDTHNAYASGLFTVPVSGKYQVSAQLHINATYVGGITTARCEIRQAGSATTAIIGQQSWPSGASNNPTRPNASIILNCIAGDTIGIYGGSDGSSLSYGAQCSLSIERVGN
jgi:hypothetical protein